MSYINVRVGTGNWVHEAQAKRNHS